MENINNLFINMDGSDDLLEYNPVQAKFCASLLWFVCRVSEHGGSEIPSEITSPIKITMTNALVVRPAVSDYLCSGQIYLTVGKVIFKQDIKTLWELIQNMSHKGVYVLDENEEAVTDLDLMEKFPFKMFSHLALMDSLMLLYSSSRVSVQNVINVVRKFSNFNASKELPFDLEDALLLWINKINQANMVDHRKHKPTTNEIVRVRKDKIVEMKIFPVVNELIDIVKDCKSLLSVLLYYLPQYIHFEDIKLSSLSSTDEFIQNIELFRSICAENICTSVFALRVEDFLYASEHLKSNFLTLLCEMFFELEVDSLKRQNVIYNIEKKIQKQISPVDTHDDSVKLLSESSSNQSNPPRSKASQPLLSKRSKQQFAKFETEHSQDLEKTKPTLPQAWVHSNEETVNKKAKISLDFRPSSGSSVRSSTVSNSASSVGHDPEQRNDESKAVPPHPRASWTDNAFYPTLPNDKQQLQQQHRHYRDDQHNQRSPMTSSSQDGASTNASFEDQLKKISMPGTFSCIERENIKPHTRESTSDSNLVLQGSHNINSDNQFVSRSRNLSYNDGIDLVHNASMQNHSCSFSLAAQEKTSPDLMHNSIAQQQQNTRHVTAGEPKKSPSHSANPYIITHTALDRNHTMTDYEDGDDDDALSTITEGTEPDAPSLYSFHSSSSTSTKYNSESDDNFSVAGRDVGGFFIDDNHVDIMKNHIHRVKTPADFIRSASTDESQDNNNRTLTNDNLVGVDGNKDDDIFEKSPTLFVRSSYTVGRGTVESALATGIPIITDSVKRSCNQLVPDSKQFQYFDVESSQNISAKESDDGRQNCLEQSTYGGSVNDSSLIPERTLQISPLDQPCDNDFEDAPFDTVNHPTSNSQSIESRSSSSGISADDGRFLSASDGEYKRPGVTLYSSLSEYTNSSPDNHFKAVAGNHGNNLKHNRSDANKEDYFKEHVSNDLTNENSDERTTKNSSEFGTGSRSLHNSSNYSPVLVKQKSVFEKKEIFNVNKALMDIGHGKDVTDCDKIITIDTKLSKSPKDAKSSERRDSLEQSESSQENSPISLYGKCNLYKNTKEKSDKLILTENSVLSNTLNKMKLFTTGNLAPSFNHWPFKKVEKKENKRKDTKEDSSGKITWCDVNPNKRKIKPTEAEEKLKQLRDSYKKSEANVAKWTDFVKEKCLHANQEIGEPLTERLASLRVQLEQKRLKFEEEKKRQQELWNQQRAKILQDAFFVMINGKENEDPSHLPESIDVATTPSAKQNASRELQLDANRDRKCKTEGEERSTKSKRESPREFVQRKREEKQKEMQSVEQQNLWFVGFDEEAKNDNSKAKNEKIKNEKLSNSANMINVNKENRGIFEKVTKLNNIDDLGEHMECELANDTVSFESERIQGEEKTNTYSLMGMANSTPPQTTELNDTSLLIKQIPTKEHIEPKIESECQTEQISKLTQISQANDDTVSQGISKPLSQLKALNSNTSKIIAKSAEMSNKIEIKIRKSESENNDLIGVKLLNTGIHPVKSYAYDEDISGDISGIVPSNSLKTEQDKETDEDKNLTARKSLSDTSNALFEEKDKWEQVIAEQATVTDNYQVSGQTTTPTDLLQSGVFTGYSTIQNPIGETFLVVDNPSIAKHQVNNYVTETKNTTDSTGFVKRFQHFSVNEETDPSYLTSTPMKRQDIESRTPQARTQENGIKVDNVFADQQPSEHSIGESDTSTTPKAKAWGVSFGDDFVGADTGLTPDQERKRSRFLKSRMKKMEESRKKKEEENEKQRLKEEELALEKEKLEDEEKLRRERLMEEKLAEATRQLQEVDFSKRLHGLTYNMDPQPTSERRKEQRQLQSPSQRNNIRAISPTSMRTVSPLEPEETNVYAEYKGPSAYQKPSGKSNRKIIQNAIMHCCLCGEVNKEAKEKCLETVSQSDASHFLVLFREGLKFKSVYEYRPETETVTRIYGIGPKTITSKMHSSYFKYNSGGKHFNALETKHLSIQVDGVMIKKELWEKKPTSSKPNSNPRKKPPMTLKPAR